MSFSGTSATVLFSSLTRLVSFNTVFIDSAGTVIFDQTIVAANANINGNTTSVTAGGLTVMTSYKITITAVVSTAIRATNQASGSTNITTLGKLCFINKQDRNFKKMVEHIVMVRLLTCISLLIQRTMA